MLAILFGVFGVHNFYIGKTGLGIAQLAITVCSCGTLAIVSEIWGIIEGVRLLQGTKFQNSKTRCSRIQTAPGFLCSVMTI